VHQVLEDARRRNPLPELPEGTPERWRLVVRLWHETLVMTLVCLELFITEVLPDLLEDDRGPGDVA
jgi:hypothetical protein